MNSEELEISLRTEFESYLSSILAEMRQEVSDFQEKFQNEFEKHKSRLDEVFQDFSSRIENDKQIDEAFKESIVEHLRLAKDEGARITASAIAEAEDRERENATALAATSGNYNEIRDAINEISSQDSQAGILKSLVNYAAHFTPRGAFFIIKNENFVGWRVFGKEGAMDEQQVREISFPMTSETILSEAVRSLSPVESNFGTFSDDSAYLDKLEFGQPDRMYAIPLIARGRGVAVLYADYGTEGVTVNVEALETLVKVAGLTVELLAAAPGARTQAAPAQTAQTTQYAREAASAFAPVSQPAESEAPQPQNFRSNDYYGQTEGEEEKYEESFKESYQSPAAETAYAAEEQQAQPETSVENAFQSETPPAGNYQDYYQDYAFEEKSEQSFDESARGASAANEFQAEPEQQYSWTSPVNPSETDEQTYVVEDVIVEEEEEAPIAGYADEARQPDQDLSTVPSYDFETPVESFSGASTGKLDEMFNENRGSEYETASKFTEQNFETKHGEASPETYAPEPVEAVSTAAAAPVKTRLSERNVDLPIEVPEEERRLHNDARRFARLLVSEIKLYNEQKVKEGRESNDLYDRLREAIDRSREMYDKRVQSPVAAKFDYFNYEIINSLAEGDETKLGTAYPGTKT